MQTQIQNEHKDHGALGQWGDVPILGKVHKEYESTATHYISTSSQPNC